MGLFGLGKNEDKGELFFKRGLPDYNVKTFLILAVVSIILLHILASVLGIYFKPFQDIGTKLGQGFLLLTIGVAVLVAFAFAYNKFKGDEFTPQDLVFLIVLAGGVIALVYFLPTIVPDIFSVARLELANNIQAVLQP